jgi:capsular polysaccharide biosynthesis protein
VSKFKKIKEKSTVEKVAKKKVDSSGVGSGKRFLNFIIDFFTCVIGTSILGFILNFFISTSDGLFLFPFSDLLFSGTY